MKFFFYHFVYNMTKYNCANYHVKTTFLTGFIQGGTMCPTPPPPPCSTGKKKKPVVGRVKLANLPRSANVIWYTLGIEPQLRNLHSTSIAIRPRTHSCWQNVHMIQSYRYLLSKIMNEFETYAIICRQSIDSLFNLINSYLLNQISNRPSKY